MERLQKYLASCGVASRRASEELITAGRVTVNGTVATLGMSVDPEFDSISVDGKLVTREERKIVVLLNKPKGVVCTSEDPQGRKTVQEYVRDIPERLYNVGRLDINTEGLILLTNDGDLANKMTHPKYGVKKTYYVVVDGILSASDAAKLANGVELEDGMTAPAKVSEIKPTKTGDSCFAMTIHEGRNRQVRRMVEAVGHKTLRLRRERYGSLTLGELKVGEWRILSPEEVEKLYREAKEI